MITEIKQQIAQLAETHRALVHDLDLANRRVAELGRERDSLRELVEQLRGEHEAAHSVSAIETRRETERLRRELALERQAAEQARRERDALGHEADSARARAGRAQAEMEALAGDLLAVEQERDEMRSQLSESSGVMKEILRALDDGPSGVLPFERPFEFS